MKVSSATILGRNVLRETSRKSEVRSILHGSKTDLGDMVTVKFLEDDVVYTCRKGRLQAIPSKPDVYKVLWKDGRRYEAIVISKQLNGSYGSSFETEPSNAPLDEDTDNTEFTSNVDAAGSCREADCVSTESSNKNHTPILKSFNSGENYMHSSLEGESNSNGVHSSSDSVMCGLSVRNSDSRISENELCASDGGESEQIRNFTVLHCDNLNAIGVLSNTAVVPTTSINYGKQSCVLTNDIYDFQPCTPEFNKNKKVMLIPDDALLPHSRKGRLSSKSNVYVYSDESSGSGEEYKPSPSDENVSDSESDQEGYVMSSHYLNSSAFSCFSHSTDLISDRNTKKISTNESQSLTTEKNSALSCKDDLKIITGNSENLFDSLLPLSKKTVNVVDNSCVHLEISSDSGKKHRISRNKENYTDSGSDSDSYVIPYTAHHYVEVSPTDENAKENPITPTNEEDLEAEVVENCAEEGTEIMSATINKITVKKCTLRADGKRKYNKVHYCFYCALPQSKIARHLGRKHKDETMVANAVKLPVKSKERKQKLEELRNRGDFKHNDRVLKAGKGELVTLKSMSTEMDHTQYRGCNFCGALCIKKQLWKHEKQCSSAPEGTSRKVRHRKLASAMMTSSIPTIVDEFRLNVVTRMHLDVITLAVKNDSLILKYGENMYEQFKHDPSQYNYVSQKLRELGRFLLALKSVNKTIKSLSEALVPKYYNDVLSAVRVVAEYDSNSNQYKIPSLALKLQTSLNVCASAVKSQALIDGDDDLADKVNKFQQLLAMNYTNKVATHALRTLQTKKWNKPLVLPVTSDIVKLHEYLQTEGDKLKKELETKPSTHVWNGLNKIVLTNIILFNRRREGEASKVFVETFTKHVGISPLHEDMKNSLSPFEQKLVTSLSRIEIRGKHGRKVPIILTADNKYKLDLLVKTRTTVGVAEANPYLFARPYENSLMHIRGHDCIREFSKLCGAKEPSAISSTKLRKHVATISQIVNLKRNEMDILAGFLGHDITVHREFYRLPEATLQVAKIGKILLGLERGLVQEFKGKTLDEITINDLDVIDPDDMDSNSVDLEMPIKTGEGASSTNSHEIRGAKRKEIPSSVEAQKNPSDQEEVTADSSQEYEVSSNNGKEVTLSKSVSNSKKGNAALQNKNKMKIRKRNHVQPWAESEKNAVTEHMKRFLVLNKVPGKKDCEECIEKCEVLKNREWRHIKYFVYNLLQKR